MKFALKPDIKVNGDCAKVAVKRCSSKRMLWKFSQKSQENICNGALSSANILSATLVKEYSIADISSVSFANFFKTKIFVFYDKTALKKFEKLVFYENYFIFPSSFTTSSFTTTLFWKTFLALKMVLSRNSNLMSTITENSHFSLNLVYKN